MLQFVKGNERFFPELSEGSKNREFHCIVKKNKFCLLSSSGVIRVTCHFAGVSIVKNLLEQYSKK